MRVIQGIVLRLHYVKMVSKKNIFYLLNSRQVTTQKNGLIDSNYVKMVSQQNIIYLLHSRQVTTQKEGLINSNLTFPFPVLSSTITKSINKIKFELSSQVENRNPFTNLVQFHFFFMVSKPFCETREFYTTKQWLPQFP